MWVGEKEDAVHEEKCKDFEKKIDRKMKNWWK